MASTYHVLACGWPEPALVVGSQRYESLHAAQLAMLERQREELPPAEGGATWHVLRIEVL